MSQPAMRPDGPRDEYAGPAEGPESPFPIKLQGPVIRGFGRGSKELGIPTANIPPSGLEAYPSLPTGIYFGYTTLHPPTPSTSTSKHDQPDSLPIYHSVLSIGYNPFYNNSTRSIEIHVLHDFPSDFYGWSLNLLLLGYIRPEFNYEGVESLIKDIKFDCEVARRSLDRQGWSVEGEGREEWKGWLRNFGWGEGLSGEEVREVEEKVLGTGVQKDGDTNGTV